MGGCFSRRNNEVGQRPNLQPPLPPAQVERIGDPIVRDPGEYSTPTVTPAMENVFRVLSRNKFEKET